jgi:hypothetical protein
MEGAGISKSLLQDAAMMPRIKNNSVGFVRFDKSISIFIYNFYSPINN